MLAIYFFGFGITSVLLFYRRRERTLFDCRNKSDMRYVLHRILDFVLSAFTSLFWPVIVLAGLIFFIINWAID
jgi:hypothetical protein